MNRSAIRAASSELPSMAEQFRAIAEIGGEVAWSIDCASGKPVYISPVIESLLGQPMAQIERQFGGAAGALAPIRAGLDERLARFAAGDLSRRKVVREFDVARRDGEPLPCEVTSTFLLDAQGVPVTLVGIVRDLSERRARHQERKRFASMLNHEFRTPLSTIDGAIQRLEATASHADEATRARYRKIGVAADRLIAMLDDYLSPERLEDIGQQRPATGVSPRVLLDEGAVQIREAGRKVALEAGALPASVRCEPAGLRLALKILIDNAIRYSPGDTAIELTGGAVENGIELIVRDGGAGIPDDEVAHIFDKVFRGRIAAGLPGSGLGLYMARSVVEVHGGSLSFLPRKTGTGAAFRIWLPLREAGKHLASAHPSSDNPANTSG